jgi:hypothetical protein
MRKAIKKSVPISTSSAVPVVTTFGIKKGEDINFMFDL